MDSSPWTPFPILLHQIVPPLDLTLALFWVNLENRDNLGSGLPATGPTSLVKVIQVRISDLRDSLRCLTQRMTSSRTSRKETFWSGGLLSMILRVVLVTH